MKLENMELAGSNVCENIELDVNLMSEKFNFCSVFQEARESGDGAELQENFNFDETPNNHQQIDNVVKKRKGNSSKIPTRRAIFRNLKTSREHSTDKEKIAKRKIVKLRKLTGSKTRRKTIKVVLCNEKTKVQTLNKNYFKLRERKCSRDFPAPKVGSDCESGEIPVEDIQGTCARSGKIDQSVNCLSDALEAQAICGCYIDKSSLTSFSSRVPLGSSDFDVPILEAPEEFRCLCKEVSGCDKQVDIGGPEGRHSEPPYRDHDNAWKTETGDTSGRTEDGRNVEESEDGGIVMHMGGVTDSSPPDLNAMSNELSAECARESANVRGPFECFEFTQCGETTGASIGIGVAKCAQASGCSRVSTAKVCVGLDPGLHTSSLSKTSLPQIQTSTSSLTSQSVSSTNLIEDHQKSPKHLSWKFNKDGRLVFEESDKVGNDDLSDNSQENEEISQVLCSKHLNKRIDEGRSRLRRLELKLKEAGITDDEPDISPSKDADLHKWKILNSSKQVVDKLSTEHQKEEYDANQNIVDPRSDKADIEILPEGSDEIDFHQDFCEFDVRQVATFSPLNGFWQVYDELNAKTSIITPNTDNMGIDGERAKHNPDHDNLKSLLKRPGKNKDRRSNRVVFNENKNEFFDADYIILIREECDYDDEDDDGVCICNQHEMVRLTCCEPNCNCTVYDGFEQTPQSPKFTPPLEFVDAVTLSPPEGYKDMELREEELLALQQFARRGQPTVCRECSVTQEDDEGGSQSDNEVCGEGISDHEDQEEKEKIDQSQQTTPTSPPNDTESPNTQNYILETITMTSVTEQRILREAEEDKKAQNLVDSPINGILKGGKLWKQQVMEANFNKLVEQQQNSDVTSDEESGSRRSVRFIESEQNQRESCDGASDNSTDDKKPETTEQNKTETVNSVSPESTEMMLTFKLGNHVLISNNSLKPNSAVRQLFPCTKPINGKIEDESIHQYLVTAESLKAFEEAKRSKLPQMIQSGETDESIKKAIERNTLRRSLIRYEPRSKKNVQKSDNSLVERIKQLTCDVDDVNTEEIPQRTSPPGEEASYHLKNLDKSFSPSSSSTTSSNSSSMSSTYKKITDLFGKREKLPEGEVKLPSSMPDLGNGGNHLHEVIEASHPNQLSKVNPATDSRKQFLSTLAPLTACVSGLGNSEDHYYSMNNIGERTSMASSVGTEYSLEDIEDVLKNGEEDTKKIAPDVLAGTPSASESGDELAMFVQQDASRIERIKKKYQPEQTSSKEEEDDENDDYGFNRRPSVRGIKPRFGSTTEILQQIQNQLQPPTANRVAWPYYSESGLTGLDNSKQRNMNQNFQYVPDETKTRNLGTQYRPTSLPEENIYQNCANQRCGVWRVNGNQNYPAAVKNVACGDYYYRAGRPGRPHSPPPQEMSKTYHQTMVYIPYNHIESYQTPYNPDYVRVSNQNQINKRYVEPIYQRMHEEHHYVSNMVAPIPLKPLIRGPQPHYLNARSESPVSDQFSTARATQTPLVTSSCNYYYSNPRYRPVVGTAWSECNYPKPRHSFPRYPLPDSLSLTDSDSQHSAQIPNGFRQSLEISFTQKDSVPNSPTKPRYLERGVPEGAASIPPQDTSNITSPTSPQNTQHSQKPLFYAMNV